MKKAEKTEKDKGFRSFVLATSVYGGASIIGPMIIFGGGGYFLDKRLETGRFLFISGMALAFIISNILLYRKAASIVSKMDSLSPAVPKEEDDEDDFEKEAKIKK